MAENLDLVLRVRADLEAAIRQLDRLGKEAGEAAREVDRLGSATKGGFLTPGMGVDRNQIVFYI